MKVINFALCAIISSFLFSRILCVQAEWSLLTYIQGDNDLAPFASYNIKDMAKGIYKNGSEVNVLVQWDQPQDNKTWRYKINKGAAVEDESLNSEMGYNPAQELIASAQWVKTKYPAKHYGVILWNHGTGIEDYRKVINSKLWLEIPGIQEYFSDRGILYDYSQNTCLTNQGLLTACAGMSQIFGQKIDLLGMDACLMAMVEVAYQVKNYVSILVASQQTEPGEGWDYSDFLSPLTQNPSDFDNIKLSKKIVDVYGLFYKRNKSVLDYTLSAIDLSYLDAIKKNIDSVVNSINNCYKIDPIATKNMIVAARNVVTYFYIESYIDLYSFYSALLNKLPKGTPKSAKILNKIEHVNRRINPQYQKALTALRTVLVNGLSIISSSILANSTGPQMKNAHGISIYYPSPKLKLSSIHASYKTTQFAQNSLWLSFIKVFRR
jgi:hypothetical protein